MLTCIILVTLYISCCSEKSDHDKMKEANKLPSFSKQEAEEYYNNELLKFK